MKRRIFRILAAVAVLALSCALTAVSLGDAGNFSGDSDWGGSSDWGGGSDWGSSDWGSSDWGSSDWGDSGSDSGSSFGDGMLWGSLLGGDSDSYSGGSGGDDLLLDEDKIEATSSDSGCTGSELVGLIVIVVIVIIVLRYIRSKKANNAANLYQAADEGPGLPLDALKQKDPNFNEQALCEKVGNDYIRMQDAWESKNWEPMRAIMTDALYQQMARQLEELRAARQTNHVDRIAVLDARIRRYTQEGDNDVLVVRLATRICDYTTDDATGQIIRGSQNKELFMTYDWKLIRDKNQTTPETAVMTAINCPNCGAPLEVNHTGKCPYCGTVVTLSPHDWALSLIKGISQRSN